jgi:general secretion pathway protein D
VACERKWPRPAQSLRSGFVAAGVVLAAAILAACNLLQEEARPPSVFDRVRAIDLLPRQPQPVESTADTPDNRRPVEYRTTNAPRTVVTGSESDTSGQQFQSAPGGEGYELNFESTPVTNVAKVVLGDILGVGYTIDPRVQGTVSLASGRPVPKSDILYILESALRVSNVALVRETAGYRLVPLAEAVGAGNVDRMAARAEPGYGVSVIPLQYVSAQTLIKLLDGFATKTGAVRADPGRNLLLIQGSGAERRAAVDTVLRFDADWMRGQSVGIFPIRNSTPEPIIAELEKVMDAGDGGMSQNVIKFQSVGRMNSILVVSRKPDLLRTAGTWISRLDRADSTTGVRVYRIRYGEARQMAKVLNDIFIGGGGASNTLDQIGNQIAPGSGLSVTSSGDRGFDTSPAGQSGRNVRQQLGVAPPPAATPAPAPAAAPLDPLSGGGPPGSSGPLLQGVRITPDVVNNTLLIYASQEHYRIIERTLRQIDRPQLQVAIDATVAEVTLNDQLSYGVQFFLTSKDLGLGADKGSALNTTAKQPPTVDAAGVAGAFLNRAFPGFNFLIGPENQPRAILDALHAVTNVKVLSNPSLVVIDNQPATLQVGDEVPISTGSATVLTTSNTIVNTIDYRNTGIILRVVPRVNVNGNVRLDIEQEISNVANTSTSATLTPTVSQRKVKSSIAVASGQTVLLAGLISERTSGDRSGIPVLDQIPGLGDVFSHRTKSINRTELIIFIRPQVIRDSVDAHVVAEELRSKLLGTIGVAPGGPVPPNVR